MQATLHYLYDPFCGWCWGAAPLIAAAAHLPGLRVQLHGGGLLMGENARLMSAEWREFVRPHEARITALSGQGFGSGYRDIAQYDRTLKLDSAPPTAAMLAAESLAGLGLAMARRLQRAYYVEGRPIAERDELVLQAQELGLAAERFEPELDRALAGLGAHVDATRALLQRLGGRGYPTLALQRQSQFELLPLGQWLGRPQPLVDALAQRLAEPPVLRAA